MAKLTYLQLVNRVLNRITQTSLASGVSSATGQGAIIANLLNEAQTALLAEGDWYSLYKTRKWNTVTYTATTISADGTGNTFDDSDSGFGSFQAGQTIYVSGFTGNTANNGIWVINTASAAQITLQSADTAVETDAAGESVTITALTYPVASDHARTVDLLDTSNNRYLIEDFDRVLDEVDPDNDSTGIPTHFSYQNSYYRFWQIPAGTYTIRENYLKEPTALSADDSTSDLPIELQNCLILYALAGIQDYQNKFDHADRTRQQYARQLATAFKSNKRKISKILSFRDSGYIDGVHGIMPPRYPSAYPQGA